MNATRILRPTMLLALGAALLLSAWGAQADEVWRHPSEMTFPELGEVLTPAIERQVLENGLVVYLLEDHEFPMVDYQVLVRAGSIYEPLERRGLAGMTGEVMRTGGTGAVAGDELDVRLETMGARLEARIGDTEGRVSGSFLSRNADEGLGLLVDLLRDPAFPEEKIELAKVGARTEIASRNDEPIQIAIREFRALMYGQDSPYGWYPEYETIEAITREDLVAFHHDYFHPDRMILTVFGDFDAAAMMPQIRAAFAEWPPNGKPLPPDPPVPDRGPRGIFYAPKEGTTSSTVLFGLMGGLASDPDYAAMRLLNQVLGSGFSSRLVNEIRTKRGLAYAVGSGPGMGWHHPGVWMAYLLTQSDSTLTASEAMRAEVKGITLAPVTEEELRLGKEILLNELVFDFSSQREVLQRKAFYEYHGYPQDFLERYQEKVRTLTAEDLLAVAQRRIHPAEIATVVVGLEEDFDGPLASLGEVTELDITIPDPPSKLVIPEPTEASLDRGQAILAAAAKAHGGEALQAIRTVRTRGEGTISMMGNSMSYSVEELRVPPDRAWRTMNIGGMFEIVSVLDGESGWTKNPQGTKALAGAELAEERKGQLREPEHLLTHYEALELQALEPAEIDGRACEVVFVREAPIREWMLYFDAETHRLAAMRYQGQGPRGPGAMEVRYTDYREVDGVQMAYQSDIFLDGNEFVLSKTIEVVFNGPLDEALFEQPE